MPHIGGGFNDGSYAIRFMMSGIRCRLWCDRDQRYSSVGMCDARCNLRPTRHLRLRRLRIVSVGIADEPYIEQG
jgi:hypothetical protein